MYASEQGTLNAQFNNEVLRDIQISLTMAFEVIKSTGAKLSKDGDQWCYGVGDLPNPDSIFGWGKTPYDAMREFCKAFGLLLNL